jgi:hypothetical protein
MRTPTRICVVVVLAVAILGATASAGQASGRRPCGPIKFGVGYPPFQVFIDHGPVSCGNARFVMYRLYHGPKHVRCYRNDASCRNGQPTDRANTVDLVAGWECGTGAGGGGCRRGHARISAEFVETAAEKKARIKREAAENMASVLTCENDPESVIIQEGSAPSYTYECISDEKLREECATYPAICREPMYSEYEAHIKLERRVSEACRTVGAYPTGATRNNEAGVREYACTAESLNVTWVSLPYIPPEEYARL